MSVFGINLGKNEEQIELVRLMNENNRPIIFATGNAGTGKTFITLASALQLKQDKKYAKIVYARNPIQLGAEMGFLPGDIDDKYLPFMGPLLDNLENIAHANKASHMNANELANRIEICPIAFLRGRSFENTILIVDEAQNLDLTTLKAILTRIGQYCKVVLLGSMNQIDDWRQRKQQKCDFQRVIDKMKDLPYVGTVDLKQSMRSPICVEVDTLLGEIDKKEEYKITFDDGYNSGTFTYNK